MWDKAKSGLFLFIVLWSNISCKMWTIRAHSKPLCAFIGEFRVVMREHPIICTDLQLRLVLTHPPLNPNIHNKIIHTLWNFYFNIGPHPIAGPSEWLIACLSVHLSFSQCFHSRTIWHMDMTVGIETDPDNISAKFDCRRLKVKVTRSKSEWPDTKRGSYYVTSWHHSMTSLCNVTLPNDVSQAKRVQNAWRICPNFDLRFPSWVLIK